MWYAIQLPYKIATYLPKNRLFSLSLREKPEAAEAAVHNVLTNHAVYLLQRRKYTTRNWVGHKV
jgi:hypothetical protein